jgi:hypothetical protein
VESFSPVIVIKHKIMKYLFLFGFLLLFQTSFSKQKVTIVFLFNDSKRTVSDISTWTKQIFEGRKRLRLSEVRMVHFTNNPSGTDETWGLGKKLQSSPFLPLKVKCDQLEENKLLSLISAYRNASAQNILMYEGQNFPYDTESVNMDRLSPLLKINPEDVYLEIDRLIKLNKGAKKNKGTKKDLNIFIYLPGSHSVDPVSVYIEDKSIPTEFNSVINLNPEYSKNVSKVQWKSSTFIDCDTCRILSLNVTQSSKYVVEVRDKENCSTSSDTVSIELVNKCNCSDNMTDIIEFEWEKNPLITPSQIEGVKKGIKALKSGAPVYDLFIKKHCAEEFLLEIYDPDGINKIWERKYLKEEVDERNLNPFHLKYPGYYIFRMNLFLIKNLLFDLNGKYMFDGVIFRITPIDSNGVKCFTISSPKINIAECE